MNKSLKYRCDSRSLKEFKKDIKNRTAKEQFLVGLFFNEIIYRNWKIRTILDNGVNNQGEIVEKSNCNADFLILYNNGRKKLIDVKNSPVDDKMTYKVYQLQQYVKQNASILLFYGTGQIDNDLSSINYKKTRFGIISPKNIQAMLDNNQHYKEPSFGNKLCIRIYKEDFEKYFKSYKLLHKE